MYLCQKTSTTLFGISFIYFGGEGGGGGWSTNLSSDLSYLINFKTWYVWLHTSINKRRIANMIASHCPISLYKNRAFRVKEVKIASKWPRPSSHHRVKLGIPSTTMVVMILQNTSYQIKFRVSKSKSITKANKNTNYRHFTYSLRIRCYLEFPAVFW